MSDDDILKNDQPLSPDERLEKELQTKALDAWTRGEAARDEQGRYFYELRAVEARLARKGRGNRSGFRRWLREHDIPRSTAYSLLRDYARQHSLPLNLELPDEFDDPEDEEPENGSEAVPFSPSESADVPTANITDQERKQDEKAVAEWLAKHDRATLRVTVTATDAKHIEDMLNSLSERLKMSKGEILKRAVENFYQEEKRDDRTNSATERPAA